MNETPIRLLEMLTQTREDLWRAAQTLAERGVTRIILTGSGTSYHGALTARTFMQRWCALPVDVCWPFMLDDETLTHSSKALVIGISQGGGSLSTLAAMERARYFGHVTASMAGVAPATIDQAADYILTVPCGEETAGAKTKGYHCTVLNLMLLALSIARQQQRLDDEQRQALLLRMEKTFNHLPALIAAAQTWTQTKALALRNSADIRLTGPATLFGTVQEGALKMLETLRCPVSGYEFEEFIHGIYNAFNSQSALIMLTPQPDARQDRLAEILGDWTPFIYRIGPQVKNNDLNLNFPFINDEDFAIFEYIIPLQMLCAILPPQKGVNPAIPKDPQFHQKMKSKQEI
ncbi:SIS domain-containing protein [Salmonella enterica]|uniref:SIS domain-containing protein n=1 Tax=Salmonella enterica subsp. VII serovar 40:z4,z24:[z39] TaxID=1967625 RepID=A0A731XTN1_SALEE|nr:SIS domain-containing protein [Salmonella enterica]EDO5296923.1 SIS domain-containing protein [Salmonella enterica subsp. houtenae serovar 40:z4,z24:-]EDS6440077.1 SIS domain-containing protein [Salmonella enterica subsp. VII str. CFSAN000550]EDT6884581.1 SIS domain-containing protein [Salmonella enterica subsp. enterica]EDU7901118.1 SIS domain-containing protein [Salmonella enterica subsp. houtenae]QJY68917.1 SIS domain-containing protein [Salmonella enterica subsp. VII serovar 1,40:g,z51: